MQLAAMASSHKQVNFPTRNSPWLTYSSCNSHITADYNQLQAPIDYSGDGNVRVGSGQELPIAHTDCGFIHTPTSLLRLPKLLLVPHISSNLLSVSKLCLDNNCLVVFDADNFFIQDKSSDTILFHGPSVNGLYPIPSTMPSSISASVANVGSKKFSMLCHFQILLLFHGIPYNCVLLHTDV